MRRDVSLVGARDSCSRHPAATASPTHPTESTTLSALTTTRPMTERKRRPTPTQKHSIHISQMRQPLQPRATVDRDVSVVGRPPAVPEGQNITLVCHIRITKVIVYAIEREGDMVDRGVEEETKSVTILPTQLESPPPPSASSRLPATPPAQPPTGGATVALTPVASVTEHYLSTRSPCPRTASPPPPPPRPLRQPGLPAHPPSPTTCSAPHAPSSGPQSHSRQHNDIDIRQSEASVESGQSSVESGKSSKDAAYFRQMKEVSSNYVDVQSMACIISS